MTISIHDLKSFYNTRMGRAARRIIGTRITEIWSDCKDMRVMGCGYSAPYLRALMPKSERTFALMPASIGAHHWPNASDAKNLIALSDQTELPIETNSIDRAIIIHDLEHSEHINHNLAEIWRVLKSNGRVIVIVPNRAGLWARSDKTPFGQGRPFSVSQLCKLMQDNQFIHERTEEALFMPPISYTPILRLAETFERIGKTAFPMIAGIHIIEASKQLYARADKGSGSPIRAGGLIPKTAISRKVTNYRVKKEQ